MHLRYEQGLDPGKKKRVKHKQQIGTKNTPKEANKTIARSAKQAHKAQK